MVSGIQCLCYLIPYNIFSGKPLLNQFSVGEIFQVVFLSTVKIQYAFSFSEEYQMGCAIKEYMMAEACALCFVASLQAFKLY
jgi:hypothetical protein